MYNAALLNKMRLKIKYSKILDEDTFLREYLEPDEKLFWSERCFKKKAKLRRALSIIFICIFLWGTIGILLWKFEVLINADLYSIMWWDALNAIITYGIVVFTICLLIRIISSRATLSDRITYYLTNKRLFSCRLRWKDRHIMTFNIDKIDSYEVERENKRIPIYTIHFKTTDLPERDMKESILIMSAKAEFDKSKRYRYNIRVDTGWCWQSESNICIIKMRDITKMEELGFYLRSLKIGKGINVENWKETLSKYQLSVFY